MNDQHSSTRLRDGVVHVRSVTLLLLCATFLGSCAGSEAMMGSLPPTQEERLVILVCDPAVPFAKVFPIPFFADSNDWIRFISFNTDADLDLENFAEYINLPASGPNAVLKTTVNKYEPGMDPVSYKLIANITAKIDGELRFTAPNCGDIESEDWQSPRMILDK